MAIEWAIEWEDETDDFRWNSDKRNYEYGKDENGRMWRKRKMRKRLVFFDELLRLCDERVMRLTPEKIAMHRSDINERDAEFGETLLHKIGDDGYNKLNDYQRIIDPDTQSEERYTDIFKNIVDEGADVNIKDRKGNTCLIHVIRSAIMIKGTINLQTLLNSGRLSKESLREGLRYCYKLIELPPDRYANMTKLVEVSKDRIRQIALMILKHMNIAKSEIVKLKNEIKKNARSRNVIRSGMRRYVIRRSIRKNGTPRSRNVMRKGIRRSLGRIRKKIAARKTTAEECPVCLESLEKSCVTLEPCHHSLHEKCMKYIFNNVARKCPVCRVKFVSSRNCISYKAYDPK